MNILAVDTSSERGSVCLRTGPEVVAEVRLATSIQHSERLFQSVDFLFKSVDVTIEDIDIFAAARGPGSFTGLRVGLAAMDGFAFAKGKRSAGVSTLAALAWQVGATEAAIAPVLDARRGEIYSTLYGWKDEELVELRTPAVLQPAEWVDSLPREAIVFLWQWCRCPRRGDSGSSGLAHRRCHSLFGCHRRRDRCNLEQRALRAALRPAFGSGNEQSWLRVR